MPSQHDTASLTDHPTVAAIRQERAKAEQHERCAVRSRHRITELLWQLVDEGHSKRSIARAIGRSKQGVSQLTVADTAPGGTAAGAEVTASREDAPVGGAS